MDFEVLRERERLPLSNFLRFLVSTFQVVQLSLVLITEFTRIIVADDEPEVVSFPIRCPSEKLSMDTNLDNFLSSCFETFQTRIEDMTERGSNWVLSGILSLRLEIGKCRLIFGGSENMRLVIEKERDLRIKCQTHSNTENSGDCFFRCLAVFFLGKNCTEQEYLKFRNECLYINVPIPVYVKDIQRFEKRNPHLQCNINVFQLQGTESSTLFPLHLSKLNKRKNQVNLLLLHFESNSNRQQPHYMLIKNLTALIRKKGGKTYGSKQRVCLNCLSLFSNTNSFNRHIQICHKFRPYQLQPCKDEPFIFFKNFRNKRTIACSGYWDFETHAVETSEGIRHIPFSFCLIFLDEEQNLLKEYTYVGYDCVKRFWDCLFDFKFVFKKYMGNYEPLNWGKVSEEEKKYATSKNASCYLCEKVFLPGEVRHRDHTHFGVNRGRYNGLLCLTCNTRFNTVNHWRKVVLCCLNAANFDHKLICYELDYAKTLFPNIEILCKSTEKITAIFCDMFRFIDVISFLPSSLEKLVNILLESKPKLDILAQSGLYYNETQRRLLTKKQCLCYEYIKSLSQLRTETRLPKKSDFFSKLNNTGLTDDEYSHSLKVFKEFGCKNLLDYVILYQRVDTYLLSEVFENYRKLARVSFDLDPLNYVTSPSYSFDCMLYKTKARIERVQDPQIFLEIESNIRGGLSLCSERYVEATPNLTKKQFARLSKSQQSKQFKLLYFDVVNLYGYCMTFPLPVSSYRYLSRQEIKQIDWYRPNENSGYGYILTCDLKYPAKYHKAHSSFPLAPESIEITYDDLSPFNKRCFDMTSSNRNYKAKKLTATLGDKNNYTLYYLNLSDYLRWGLVLTKIHSVISFREENFMKTYVETCADLRRKATNNVEKTIYKSSVNTLYGKTLENVRDRTQCNIITTRGKMETKLLSNQFTSFNIIKEGLVFSFQKSKVVRMTNPILCAFVILERAKLSVYRLFYDTLRPTFRDISFLYGDTDSLICKLTGRSHHWANKKIRHVMDMSNQIGKRKCDKNKGKLGFLKDETGGNKILAYCGIRSKVYSFITKDQTQTNVCKGVKSHVRKKIPFSIYKKCLKKPIRVKIKQFQLTSKHQKIFLREVEKIAFTSFSDKTFILNCGIHSVPLYSCHISEELKRCSKCNENENKE